MKFEDEFDVVPPEGNVFVNHEINGLCTHITLTHIEITIVFVTRGTPVFFSYIIFVFVLILGNPYDMHEMIICSNK